MGDEQQKPSLFRRIEIPDAGIPRAPKDAREIKNDRLRHLTLSKLTVEAEYKKRRQENRKARKNDQEEDPVE